MRRINDNEIVLTNKELASIQFFIEESLYRQWDYYTDHVITNLPRSEGERKMNPIMYDMAREMGTI